MAKAKTKSHNLVANCPPLYLSQLSTYDPAGPDDNATPGTITLTNVGTYAGYVQGWYFELIVSPTSLTMTCYTRDKFHLGGIYDQEKVLYPIGNNIQSAEPPLWTSVKPESKYLREVEFFTTQKLTGAEIGRAVNYAMPILPAFLSNTVGPEAYMDDSQLIAGRSRLYMGNTLWEPTLGFGVLAHESVLGQGEPIVAPELHYARGFYMYALFDPLAATNWLIADFPAVKDILSVVETSPPSEVAWMAQAVRGASLDNAD